MGCSVAPAGCETEVRQRRPYERIVVACSGDASAASRLPAKPAVFQRRTPTLPILRLAAARCIRRGCVTEPGPLMASLPCCLSNLPVHWFLRRSLILRSTFIARTLSSSALYSLSSALDSQPCAFSTNLGLPRRARTARWVAVPARILARGQSSVVWVWWGVHLGRGFRGHGRSAAARIFDFFASQGRPGRLVGEVNRA